MSVTIKREDFREDGDNALVWSVNGKEYRFTKATPGEADNLEKGVIVVRDGKIYICKELPKGKLQCSEHLCATCTCERFVECAHKMGRSTSNLHRYIFVEEAVETKGKGTKNHSIITKCSDYLQEKSREEDPLKRAALVSLAKELLVDSKQSKNYGKPAVKN